MKKRLILIPIILIIVLELLNFEYSTLSNMSLGRTEWVSISIIACWALAIILQFKYNKLSGGETNLDSST